MKKTAVAESIQEVGAYKKGELTPYQIYRRVSIVVRFGRVAEVTTDKMAAWKEYQAEYLKSMQEQMKRDKDLLKKRRIETLSVEAKET